jgi:L-lactate dehydrogenase (cytochrome)
MGRPFLYSLTYGEEGVVHAIESKSRSFSHIFLFIVHSTRTDFMCRRLFEHRALLYYKSVLILVMRDEIATTMRLLGVTRLDQLGPHLVSQFLHPSRVFTSNLFLLSIVFPKRWRRRKNR